MNSLKLAGTFSLIYNYIEIWYDWECKKCCTTDWNNLLQTKIYISWLSGFAVSILMIHFTNYGMLKNNTKFDGAPRIQNTSRNCKRVWRSNESRSMEKIFEKSILICFSLSRDVSALHSSVFICHVAIE